MKARPPSRPAYVILGLLLLGLIYYPHRVDPFLQHVAILTLWFIYLSIAWNISAMTHMYSIMHGLFLGAGADAAALLFLKLGVTPYLGIWGGVVVALAIALLLGYLGFRAGLSPLFFVIMTLAVGFIADLVALGTPVLGKEIGLPITFFKDNPGMWQWVGKLPHYYTILGMAVGVAVFQWFILRSKLGLYFKAIP